MNIAMLRTSYIQKVNADRVMRQARQEALQEGKDNIALWHTYHLRAQENKEAKRKFKADAKEFASMVAGDVELSKLIGKFFDEREAANKAILDAVRNKPQVIIPGDKQ